MMTIRTAGWAMMVAAVACFPVGAEGGDKKAKNVTISATGDGADLSVTVSRALAWSLFEAVIGSELECGTDLDREFETLLRDLDRGGRGSRAALRDGDGTLTAHRSGRSLKLRFEDTEGGGGLKVKMPWKVAECLLDGSATLDAKDARSIKIELTGGDGGSFRFKVD
jgi:hypothetical protein